MPALQLPDGPDAGAAGRPADAARRVRRRPSAARPTLARARRARRLPQPGVRHAHVADGAARRSTCRARSRPTGRPLRPDAVRPVVPARPAAGRGRRAVRAGELERPRRGRGGLRRRRLGPPLPQLPDHAGPPRPVARPGAVRAARPTCDDRGLLDIDAGARGRRVRPRAEDQRQGRPRALAGLFQRARAGGGVGAAG